MAFCQVASDQAHGDSLESLPLWILGHAAKNLGHIGSHKLQAINEVLLLAMYRGVTTGKFNIFFREQLCPLMLLETKQLRAPQFPACKLQLAAFWGQEGDQLGCCRSYW